MANGGSGPDFWGESAWSTLNVCLFASFAICVTSPRPTVTILYHVVISSTNFSKLYNCPLFPGKAWFKRYDKGNMRLAFCFVVFHSFVWYPMHRMQEWEGRFSTVPFESANAASWRRLGGSRSTSNHVSIYPSMAINTTYFLFVGWWLNHSDPCKVYIFSTLCRRCERGEHVFSVVLVFVACLPLKKHDPFISISYPPMATLYMFPWYVSACKSATSITRLLYISLLTNVKKYRPSCTEFRH